MVTWGVEQTLNKSQHRKLTLEKKILPPLLPGFELTTFQSWVWHSNQQAILALTNKLSWYIYLGYDGSNHLEEVKLLAQALGSVDAVQVHT